MKFTAGLSVTVLQATNITWQAGAVPRESKERLLSQHSCVVWFTGLSGAGKSTVACALEHALHQRGVITALLDGDNVRCFIVEQSCCCRPGADIAAEVIPGIELVIFQSLLHLA